MIGLGGSGLGGLKNGVSAAALVGLITGFGAQGLLGPTVVSLPTSLAISANSIAETAGAGTVIGTLTATALGRKLTWSIPNSADRAVFQIWGGEQNKLALNWKRLNRATTASYSPTIQVTDELGNTATFNPAISVTAAAGTPATLASTTGTALVPLVSVESRFGVTAQNGAANGVSLQGGAAISAGAGPAGQDIINIPSGGYLSLGASTGALSAFTVAIVYRPAVKATIFMAGLSGSGNNALNYLQTQSNAGGTNYYNDKLVATGGTTGSTTLTSTTRFARLGRPLIRVITFDGTTVSDYIDNMATAVASSAGQSGKTFTFDQIAKAGAVAPTGVLEVMAVHIYSAALNATDRAALAAYHEPDRRHRVYVSTAGADATTNPTSTATPYGTIAQAVQYAASGDHILFNRGEIWNSNISATGCAGAYFGAYGSGNAPAFEGVAATTSWTNVSGNLWTTTLTFNPQVIWAKTGATAGAYEYTKCTPDAGASSAWNGTETSVTPPSVNFHYVWDGASTLTVLFPAGFDPRVSDVRIAPLATTSGIAVSGSTTTTTILADLRVRFWNGWAVNANTGVHEHWRVEGSWVENDAFGDAPSSASLFYCTSWGAGPGFLQSGNGDNYSYHGDVTVLLRSCVGYSATRGAVRMTATVYTTIDGCYFEDSYDPICGLNQNAGSQTNPYLIVRNTVYVMTDSHDASNKYAVQPNSGLTNFTTTVENCTFINKMTTKTGSVAVMQGSGTSTTSMSTSAKFNVFYNFALDTSVSGSGGSAPVADYNIVFGGALQAVGVSQGGHSAVADPLFTNYAAGDYTLQAASPALHAAIGSTVTRDRDGRQRPYGANSDIGAYERAA